MARQVRPWLTQPVPVEGREDRQIDRASTSETHQGRRREPHQSPDVRVQSRPSSPHELRAWQRGVHVRLASRLHRWVFASQAPGGQETGLNPTDRGKLGSKRHLIVDARCILLVVLVNGANRHDSKMFERCIDAMPAIKGLSGRPRQRPIKLHVDKGYDYRRCRAHLRQRGIKSRIARRGIESSERLGKHRWVVERTHAWFAGFGKLRIRFERRLDIHQALLSLAAAIICSRFVDRWC